MSEPRETLACPAPLGPREPLVKLVRRGQKVILVVRAIPELQALPERLERQVPLVPPDQLGPLALLGPTARLQRPVAA